MLITASVDFVHISRGVRRREQNIIHVYALVNVKPRYCTVEANYTRVLSATADVIPV